jgi:hypothetical protein
MTVNKPDRLDVHDGMPPRLRRLLVTVPVVVLAVLAIEHLELTPSFPLTFELMRTQDAPVLVLVGAVLLALAAWRLPAAWNDGAARLVARAQVLLVVSILGAAVVVALGTQFLVRDTPVSHDENMSKFDTQILSTGQLMAPIPPEWRAFSWALKPAFRLPVPGDLAWVSTYLPGNAALRAGLGWIFGPAVVNAILVGAALLALLAVARRLWPEQREAWVLAVVLMASSSQVLGMGMTPFAMTAHLLLNLVWLGLYLRNTYAGHAGAIAVGFWATGLHQLVFHPLFVAPFIAQMLLDRRWRLAALYVASYGAIGVFWIVYWQMLLWGHGIAPEAASAMGTSFFITRVASMLRDFSISGPETMLQNLLRFAAWQNPLLVVLLVPGMVLGWRAGGVLRALAAGIVLTLAALLILLPYQDIGWGYRYFHGLIGGASLLAAFAWTTLNARASLSARRVASGVMAAITTVAVLVLAPIHARQMYAYISPYTRANQAITASTAEAVVIETISVGHGIELVRNDPDLRNRPLVFDIGLLDEKLIQELCARMTVTVFDGEQAERFGMARFDPAKHPGYPKIQPLRAQLERPPCRR